MLYHPPYVGHQMETEKVQCSISLTLTQTARCVCKTKRQSHRWTLLHNGNGIHTQQYRSKYVYYKTNSTTRNII